MALADKWTVARVLDEIAQYLELSDPNRFKSRAFERAARAVENLERDIADIVASGKLLETPGIGKAIGPIIEELVSTGQSRYLDELRKQFPAGIFDLLRVPALGLKKIGVLYDKLGVGSLDQLESAALEGKVAKLKGFGAKTQTKILEGIEKARKRESQYLLPTALEVGERIRERLAQFDEIENAEVVGSVRRRLEVVRNVNVAISTADPKAVMRGLTKVVDRFEIIDEVTARGWARNEMTAWFHLSKPADFGTTVLRTTGSAEFIAAFEKKAGNIKARTEIELFKRAGIPFVEPERRESADVLKEKKRARLVEPDDLRGTFHVHTTYSDGRNSVLQMLSTAKERGYEYVGISDHSKTAYYAGGLTEDRVDEQQAEIAEKEKEVKPLRVFRGTEADILADGSIDYGPQVLKRFDFVVASVHSQFNMPKDQMTERILKALDDPHVTFLGHLTGRKLLVRDGYSVEFDRIFEKAGERGVMIELNGNPYRLDLDWRLVPRALDRGVIFSIHPDAHSIAEMSHVISGTWVARKAGLSPKHIFNTRPVEEVEEVFALRKKLSAKR